MKELIDRREFIKATGMATAGTLLANPIAASVFGQNNKKVRLAMVGTGIRGITFWGKNITENYNVQTEFVGLCDINPGRVEFARKYIGAKCNTYTDFEKMMKKEKPDVLIVTTVDATHDQFIIKALEMGVDVITEKPMTTDEVKCKNILDAEKRTGKQVIVGFNYRYGI